MRLLPLTVVALLAASACQQIAEYEAAPAFSADGGPTKAGVVRRFLVSERCF